jgi:predicted PurR-regulated permease PerM
MTTPEPSAQPDSPIWGSTTKLVVGLTFVAIIAALLVRFQTLMGPLILAFMLTYLLHPLVESLNKATRLSWRMSVNLVYIVLVIILVSLFTATGFAVVQQFQSLVRVIERFVTELPEMLENLSTQSYIIGPYYIDFSQYLSTENLTIIADQVLSAVQPLLGQAGGLLATVASQTASTVGWGFFVVLVSYFLLAEMARIPNPLNSIEIPGYGPDINRLSRELTLIWNAFLRGQVILFTLTLFVFSMVLSALGTRFFLALALLAGLARFVPYVGPVITWTVTALVAYFQAGNYLGLVPWQYALVVIIFVIVVDNIFDNLVSPRILGETLGVHPAAVLVAAIIAANLLGLVGVVLAAPVLASLTLVGRYTLRKMLDVDPWPEPELKLAPVVYPWVKWGTSIQNLISRLKDRFQRAKEE